MSRPNPSRGKHRATRKGTMISIQVTLEDLAVIDAAAERVGMGRSAFLRMCALDRAREGVQP